MSVPVSKAAAFEKHFAGDFLKLGTVNSSNKLHLTFAGQKAEASLGDLQKVWSEGVTNVYHA
ncbi:hypothetical protein D3C87_1623030 [compost metagenome]